MIQVMPAGFQDDVGTVLDLAGKGMKTSRPGLEGGHAKRFQDSNHRNEQWMLNLGWFMVTSCIILP